MPPSQLKALKSSLREKGIVGPQKSKKQKKSSHARQNPHDRAAALQQIRDSFNPFECRPGNARPAKSESVSYKSAAASQKGGKHAAVLHRPGVTKSAGEELRRRQLLPEMRKRNKVGGLVDRRIGEGDAGMTAEERAVQRFAWERTGKKSLFDLEGSEDEGKVRLTHFGRGLDELDGETMVGAEEEESGSGSESDGLLKRKRKRTSVDDEDGPVPEEEGVEGPERKKTKKEVMQEVIAKSKYHKYERQKAAEDDEDLREKLDAGMADLVALLRGHQPKLEDHDLRQADATANGDGSKMDPGRQALLEGLSGPNADKEYERRLRELAQDTRAKPAERTKTVEERATEEAEKLREAEEKRLRRMRGEALEDEDKAELNGDEDMAKEVDVFGNEEAVDDAEDFGFTNVSQSAANVEEKAQHEDEDDFDFDDNLVASASDAEASEDESEAGSVDPEAAAATQEKNEEDEFVKGILDPPASGANTTTSALPSSIAGLSYTYPCPRTHHELLDVLEPTAVDQLPTIIQRIRALHHPSLSAANHDAMSDFSTVLVGHIAWMAEHNQPLPIIEQLIRHVHSLSRTYSIPVAEAFRKQLQEWHNRFSERVRKGDLMILVAIGSVYPTSDHFHQVATPAITFIGRWLGLNGPHDVKKSTVGAFLVGLSLSYQKLSKRYIPEAVRFTLHALELSRTKEDATAHIENLTIMADLWQDKTAFVDIFAPFVSALRRLQAAKALQHLQILLQQAKLHRRPLELHHHRKMAIRSSIPKFEEGFNPDKHYDPDKERSEARKLQKDFKREKKGAVRELRKDASFMAREQLRDKRERDAEHERKQRRLIAEIQGEAAGEAKGYERAKARR